MEWTTSTIDYQIMYFNVQLLQLDSFLKRNGGLKRQVKWYLKFGVSGYSYQVEWEARYKIDIT